MRFPPFQFRIRLEDARAYRASLGLAGDAPLMGMALRATASKQVADAIADLAKGRYPIHAGQDCHAKQQLRLDVDYRCEIELLRVSEDRLRLEQRLTDGSGMLCLRTVSDIILTERQSHVG